MKTNSPFADKSTAPSNEGYRFSIGTMLLAMFVCGGMGGALFYASRVAVLRNEIVAVFGVEPAGAETNRMAHLTFLLYCYSAPLLLTGVFGLGYRLVSLVNSWSKNQAIQEEESWDAGLVPTTSSQSVSDQFRVTKAERN